MIGERTAPLKMAEEMAVGKWGKSICFAESAELRCGIIPSIQFSESSGGFHASEKQGASDWSDSRLNDRSRRTSAAHWEIHSDSCRIRCGSCDARNHRRN